MATAPIPAREPIKVLADILQSELGLKDGQVMLAYQNFEVPTNTGLYIALSYGVQQTVGNNNQNSVDLYGNYVEVQSYMALHEIEVDIMSFDNSARTRKEQVLWAVQSYNATSLMNKYSMKLAKTPGSFISVDSLEPAKQLNRFRITIAMYALHQNTKGSPYYDNLQPVKLTENP